MDSLLLYQINLSHWASTMVPVLWLLVLNSVVPSPRLVAILKLESRICLAILIITCRRNDGHMSILLLDWLPILMALEQSETWIVSSRIWTLFAVTIFSHDNHYTRCASSLMSFILIIYLYAHVYVHVYVCICTYLCVCVCVCLCVYLIVDQ